MALDPDTVTSPASYEVALLAAGAALTAVERVMEPPAGGEFQAAFALVRPPGHHAERDHAMGFCLFNNVAVAARHALALGASRVAVIDYDVHHGNGTQAIFSDDPRVLVASIHQYPFYPGTGAVDEIGTGAGEGFTLNVPLAAGATDGDYLLAFSEVIEPAVSAFRPDLLLVSAGYDAHDLDPLARMHVTTPGFRQIAERIRALAEADAAGRAVFVLEGGYNLDALAGCLGDTVAILAGPPRPGAPGCPEPSWRGRAVVEEIRAAGHHRWAGI